MRRMSFGNLSKGKKDAAFDTNGRVELVVAATSLKGLKCDEGIVESGGLW